MERQGEDWAEYGRRMGKAMELSSAVSSEQIEK